MSINPKSVQKKWNWVQNGETGRDWQLLLWTRINKMAGKIKIEIQCNYLITKQSEKLNNSYWTSKREVNIHKSREVKNTNLNLSELKYAGADHDGITKYHL